MESSEQAPEQAGSASPSIDLPAPEPESTPLLDAADQALGGAGRATGGFLEDLEQEPSLETMSAGAIGSGLASAVPNDPSDGEEAPADLETARPTIEVDDDPSGGSDDGASDPEPTAGAEGEADAGGGTGGGEGAPSGEAGDDGAEASVSAGPDPSLAQLQGENTADLVSGFTRATASVQAAMYGDLGSTIDETAQSNEVDFQQSLPDVEVDISAPEPEGAAPIDLHDTAQDVTQDGAAPTAEPEIEPTEDPGPFRTLRNFGSFFAGFGEGEGADVQGNAEAIGDAISSVPTTDNDIGTSPGPAPDVPLQGQTDPARVPAQSGEAELEIGEGFSEAVEAVQSLPGRARVPELEVHETLAIPDLDALAATPDLDVPEGMEGFMELSLSADVVGAFDELYSQDMNDALAEVEAEVEVAEADLEQGRTEELSTFEREREAEIQRAREEGDAEVAAARASIDEEKEATLAEQARARAEVEGEIRTERARTLAQIDAKVAESEARVNREFADAQRRADQEVSKGEREAAAEKRKAERESENQSWWDRAKSFVSDAISALSSVVSGIFDAVRSVVNTIIEGVKALAETIIDAAVSFINQAIDIFGDLLKGAIQGLVGSIFPGLADALCAVIDHTVDAAKAAVSAVAEGLKAGLNALLDGLQAGLNALLDIYEGVITGALALADAIVTGNWQEFLLMALEAALSLAGIDKEDFYGFVGRAEETIQIVVDDPGAFVGNCIDALGTGFEQFQDNFTDHLQSGFVGWMTGQIGDSGLEMPDQFDLPGVLDLTLQVLGLTPDALRDKAVEHVGEEAVEAVEFVWGYIDAAIQGGLDGLWEHLKGHLSSLWDMVIGEIKSWLVEKIVMKAVTKIASMFSPVGAIVQAILTAWNMFTFVRDQIQEVWGVFTAIVDGVGDIVRGNISNAANMVEGALASSVPIAIDFLAKLLGLSGLGKRVKGIIEDVQAMVDNAIEAMIEKVKDLFRGGDGEGEDQQSVEPDEDAVEVEPVLGKEQRFNSESGGLHRIWVDTNAGDVPMVASDPLPVHERLDGWSSKLSDLDDLDSDERSRAQDAITAARAHLDTVDQSVEEVRSESEEQKAKSVAKDEVLPRQLVLAEHLSVLFGIFGDHPIEEGIVQFESSGSTTTMTLGEAAGWIERLSRVAEHEEHQDLTEAAQKAGEALVTLTNDPGNAASREEVGNRMSAADELYQSMSTLGLKTGEFGMLETLRYALGSDWVKWLDLDLKAIPVGPDESKWTLGLKASFEPFEFDALNGLGERALSAAMVPFLGPMNNFVDFKPKFEPFVDATGSLTLKRNEDWSTEHELDLKVSGGFSAGVDARIGAFVSKAGVELGGASLEGEGLASLELNAKSKDGLIPTLLAAQGQFSGDLKAKFDITVAPRLFGLEDAAQTYKPLKASIGDKSWTLAHVQGPMRLAGEDSQMVAEGVFSFGAGPAPQVVVHDEKLFSSRVLDVAEKELDGLLADEAELKDHVSSDDLTSIQSDLADLVATLNSLKSASYGSSDLVLQQIASRMDELKEKLAACRVQLDALTPNDTPVTEEDFGMVYADAKRALEQLSREEALSDRDENWIEVQHGYLEYIVSSREINHLTREMVLDIEDMRDDAINRLSAYWESPDNFAWFQEKNQVEASVDQLEREIDQYDVEEPYRIRAHRLRDRLDYWKKQVIDNGSDRDTDPDSDRCRAPVYVGDVLINMLRDIGADASELRAEIALDQ
ncbi:MAG: hypothetical protein EA397_09950 [Deltaproteobacteria bacterium]|nr:MAG: hypothetical protein EA397_09950 [Deltaproteobacteria bacterium]